jgi:hypothetical protein
MRETRWLGLLVSRCTRLSAGAYVIGRNMFGPGRGAWDPDWKGW